MQISKSVEDNAWWPQAKQGSLDISFPAPLPGEIYNLSIYKKCGCGYLGCNIQKDPGG